MNNGLSDQVFQGEKPQKGFLSRWTLMLHGTKDPPYAGIEPLAGHQNSKLEVNIFLIILYVYLNVIVTYSFFYKSVYIWLNVGY